MSELDRLTRWMVYHHFRESGTAPPIARLSRLVDASIDETREALRRLHEARALVLEPETDRILMAHPFAARPSGYRVRTQTALYEANCAWDALSIPALLEQDGRIESVCPVTADPLRLVIREGELQPTTSLIHFLVPAGRFWDDIGFT